MCKVPLFDKQCSLDGFNFSELAVILRFRLHFWNDYLFSWKLVMQVYLLTYNILCPNGQTVSAVDSSASWVNVSRCEFKSSYIP